MSSAANGQGTREKPALGMWGQHIHWESMEIKIRSNLEVLMLPCLLKTISSSLESRSWSWPDLVHAEALKNGGKQGGFCGFSPSRAAVQKGSDSLLETRASTAPVTAPRGGLSTEH